MDPLESLKKQREEAVARMKALVEATTDEDIAAFAEAEAEVAALEASIKRREAVIAATAVRFNATPPQDQADPPLGAETPDDTTTPPNAETREAWEDDPLGGFALEASSDLDRRAPYALKEYLVTISNDDDRQPRDPRLRALHFRSAVGSDEQTVSGQPWGGYTVPTGFDGRLLSIRAEDDFLAGRATSIPMTSPSYETPARVDQDHSTSVAGGLTVAWTPETLAAATSREKFKKIRLEAHELVGATYASRQILRYSALQFAAELEASFSEAFSDALVEARLFGNGAGRPKGMITTGAGHLIVQAAESAQGAATIIYENVVKMRSRAWGYGNCIWVANHDTLPQLMMMNFTATAIAPIWQPSAREDHPDMLLGRPLIFSENMQTLGAQGDIACINMSQYLEGRLEGLTGTSSMHVRFLEREETFLFGLSLDGAPWWEAVLTPKNSATTRSPAVVLNATRT